MNIEEAIKKAIDGEILVKELNDKKYYLMWCKYSRRFIFFEDQLYQNERLQTFPLPLHLQDGWEIHKEPVKMLAQDVLKKLGEFGEFDLNYDKKSKKWFFVDMEEYNHEYDITYAGYTIEQINKRYNWNIELIESEELKIEEETNNNENK
jgi:hypothetical protein